MSQNDNPARSIKERCLELIPIDKIVVRISRTRDKEQFKEQVRSISELGLYQPIRVNGQHFKKRGKYELIYGEGRLEAYRQLGETEIPAEIVYVDDEQALLEGLAENLTRAKKEVVDFMRYIFDMHKRGIHIAELARITGKSELTLTRYIDLMKNGEERLICSIEAGLISFSFAMKVIECPESEVQHFLLNEFLNGKITMRDVDSITKLLNERTAKGQSNKNMKMPKLKAIIKKTTDDHKLFYEQHKVKRDDAIYLNASLTTLWKDKNFCKMISAIKNLPTPALQGQYGTEKID